jgi:hypothetical protein
VPVPVVVPPAPTPPKAEAKVPKTPTERAKAVIEALKNPTDEIKRARESLKAIQDKVTAEQNEAMKVREKYAAQVRELDRKYDISTKRRLGQDFPAEYEKLRDALYEQESKETAAIYGRKAIDGRPLWEHENEALGVLRAAEDKRRAELMHLIEVPVEDRAEWRNTATFRYDKGVRQSQVNAVRERWTKTEERVTKLISKDRHPKAYTEVRVGGRDVRANYNQFRGIELSIEDSESTMLHEITHDLEFRYYEISKASKEFLKKRAGGMPAAPLSKLTGIKAYDGPPIERAFEDEWKLRGGDPYSGKDYGISLGTELLTTGIERLVRDPLGFAEKDPEYFTFLLEQLQGK